MRLEHGTWITGDPLGLLAYIFSGLFTVLVATDQFVP